MLAAASANPLLVQERRRIVLYPAHLARHRPPQGLAWDVAAGDDLASLCAEPCDLLAALHLPEDHEPEALPPLFALGPAVWASPGRALVGAARGGGRAVAARALETLGGLLADGPLPPSPRPLRVQVLREALGPATLAVAGGGRVGRALAALARAGRLRCQVVSDHPGRELRGAVPWSRGADVLGRARGVVWASDRPLAPVLPSLAREGVLVVVAELSDADRSAVLASLADRAATALALYRPLDLPPHERLVVLTDSPRRQALAMAQLWRHLGQQPPP